jgi:hypothetical protein
MSVLSFGVSSVPLVFSTVLSYVSTLTRIFKVFIKFLLENDNVCKELFSNPVVLCFPTLHVLVYCLEEV